MFRRTPPSEENTWLRKQIVRFMTGVLNLGAELRDIQRLKLEELQRIRIANEEILRRFEANSPLSTVHVDNVDTFERSLSPPDAIQIVINFYMENPDARDLSVRQAADLIGVGKSTVSNANKWIRDNNFPIQ